jgi:hypothetical protein
VSSTKGRLSKNPLLWHLPSNLQVFVLPPGLLRGRCGGNLSAANRYSLPTPTD